MQRTLLLASTTLLLTACAAHAPKDPYGPAITYNCSGGEQITARYQNDDSDAKVAVRGKSEILPQAITADGRKFDNGHVALWNKGDDARLRVAGDLVWQTCRDASKGAPPGIITGTVTFSEQVALPDKAVMVVKLMDVSLADAPPVLLAQDQVNPTRLPAAYEVQYDASKLQAGHTYVVQATVYDGTTLSFINDTQRRVLINGPEVGPIQVQVIKAGQQQALQN